jgi:hypothetical protein
MTAKRSRNETYTRIRDSSETLPRIEVSRVAEALGAEPSELMRDSTGGPLSLFQVKQELLRRLQSTGGRPSLSGASGRKKVPLSDSQWEQLEGIAADVASPGFLPSAGQIASVLLALSLRWLHRDKVAQQKGPDMASGELTSAGG